MIEAKKLTNLTDDLLDHELHIGAMLVAGDYPHLFETRQGPDALAIKATPLNRRSARPHGGRDRSQDRGETSRIGVEEAHARSTYVREVPPATTKE